MEETQRQEQADAGAPGEDRAAEDAAEDANREGALAESPGESSQHPGSGREADAGGGGEVQELRDELDRLNDRHLRLAAEFDNYRKRNERERQALTSRLQSDLVTALLDVMDDLERVESMGSEGTAESVVEGVRLVEKKFLGVLEGAGLEPVDADSAPFDPEVMEALMAVPTDDPEKDDHVADVFQRGYRFRGRLLRPARVRVFQYDASGEGD